MVSGIGAIDFKRVVTRITVARELLYRTGVPLKIAVAFFVLVAATALAQVPAGSPFTISSAHGVLYPSAVTDAAGNFTVVWTADESSQFDVWARRFDVTGNPLGPGLRVNTYTTGYQGSGPGARAASDAAGNVTVVWSSAQDGSGSGVYAQRFAPSGDPRGSEFRVNSYTTASQQQPSVAADRAGNVFVVWSSDGQDGDGRGVFGRRYDATGAPRGTEFQVNTATAGNQYRPAVASDDRGNVVVVWSKVSPTAPTEIRAQLYDSAGVARGGEFRVNGAASAVTSIVRSDADGNFAVVWAARDAITGPFRLVGRRFDHLGTALGDEFRIDVPVTRAHTIYSPISMAMDAGGAFVASWFEHQPPLSYHTVARRFHASGEPRGAPFELVAPGFVASDASGNFTHLWGREGPLWGQFQRFGGLVPSGLRVDPFPSASSDGNGVLEHGESVDVLPFWRNVNGAAQTFGANASSFDGPPAPGVTYSLEDSMAGYATVPNGNTAPCIDSYRVAVPAGGERPATHWDAKLEERITPDAHGQATRRPIHIGQSFTDVPKTSAYYRFVETLLHRGVTAGCQATSYCPADVVTREQLAAFVLLARDGSEYRAPDCGATPVFGDVPVGSPSCRWVEELARRGVVSGCGGGNFCPSGSVTREQMAVFVLRTLDGALVPPACVQPTLFGDVPETSSFCPWVEELARRGVVSGCGGGNFCPSGSVTREQMAVFLSGTFGLALYGP